MRTKPWYPPSAARTWIIGCCSLRSIKAPGAARGAAFPGKRGPTIQIGRDEEQGRASDHDQRAPSGASLRGPSASDQVHETPPPPWCPDGRPACPRRGRGHLGTRRRTWVPSHQGPRRLPPVEAAFFDLDKTVIARASMAAFGHTFYRGGLDLALHRRAGAGLPARLSPPGGKRAEAQPHPGVGAEADPGLGPGRGVPAGARGPRRRRRAHHLRRGHRAHRATPGRRP